MVDVVSRRGQLQLRLSGDVDGRGGSKVSVVGSVVGLI